MDADERLTALKKAYADIILNTAEEASARIMLSERKALRFHHELNATKEQALQTLLRLKQTMDSEAKEAGMTFFSQKREIEELKAQLRDAEVMICEGETTSLSQQKRIEELEAQLQEAEDIVKDLREELKGVQTELERVRNSKLQYMNEHDIDTREQTQENILNSSQFIIFPPQESLLESSTASDMKNLALSQRNEVDKCYNVNDNSIGNPCIVKPNLPSTAEKNRPNTSQSIVLPLPESRAESFTVSDMTNSSFNQRKEVHKCYSANGFRMVNSYKPILPSIILKRKEPEPYRNRRTQRIRAFEEKLMAGELSFSETIDDVKSETSGREDGKGDGICKTPIHEADNMCSTKKKDLGQADSSCYQVQNVKSFRWKGRRATRCKKNKTPSSRHLSNQALKSDQTSDKSCTEGNSINNTAQSGGDLSTMASRLSAGTADKGTLLGCTQVTESDTEFVKAVSVEYTSNDKEPVDKLLMMRWESGSANSSGVPLCRMDVQRVDVPVVNSQTKISCTTNGIPNQLVAERVIKYTFQRKKRKKESLSDSDGNASLENSLLKKKAAEKQNNPLEMLKSTSVTESSRGSRHLAQAARQLISLSEKKWWQ